MCTARYQATATLLQNGEVLVAGGEGATANLASAELYGPPLLGNASVENHVDYNPSGTAEAFPTSVSYSRQLSSLELYVDQRSTASQLVIGIYSDNDGQPGTLQSQATLTNMIVGSWNLVAVPAISLTAGERVWIAILGPSGDGTLRFRDDPQSSSGQSQTSEQTNLTALPTTWSAGTTWPTGNLSAYGQ